MPDSPAPGSVGRLFGDGLDHWLSHQRLFWMLAGPMALTFAAFKYANAAGWSKNDGPNGAIAVFYALAVAYWLRNMLYDDWRERVARARRDRAQRRRLASVGNVPVMVFFAAYGGFVFILSLLLLIRTGSLDSGGEQALLVMAFSLQALLTVIATVLFGGLLLYLPARCAGLSWGIGEAYREAQGMRGQLIVFGLLCTILSLGGSAAIVLVLDHLPDDPWLTAVARALVLAVDFLALYVLAYGVARLFVAKTGWKPEPLPT